MKLWKKLVLCLVTVIFGYALFVFITIRSMDIEQLSEDLFVIRGVGSNTTVLRTTQGTVVIDSMTFPMQGSIIRAKAEELTGSKVALLINTHYHLDHTHGNPGFELGTRIVATERTLSHLKALDADFWKGDAAQLLPNELFSEQLEIRIGGKTLLLSHPGRGHTDGDLVVLIEEEKTIAMGDLLFYKHYPNIDLEAGGSVSEWPSTLDKVLALDFETVIPGHGITTNRLGIQDFQRFMGQLTQIGIAAASDNSSLEETLNTSRLTADKSYTPMRIVGLSLGVDREFVLRRTWEEATGDFEIKN
jgi:glyoxylase-like metal-dependent hydrolase (beta-lactamase superfamily II)